VRVDRWVSEAIGVHLVLQVLQVLQVYRFSASDELSEQLDVQVSYCNIPNPLAVNNNRHSGAAPVKTDIFSRF